MRTIKIDEVAIPTFQRELRQNKVARIVDKIKVRGYNPSYPITLDERNELVDGGHRLEAAKIAGMTEIPFVRKPADVSSATHAINCNLDGADTTPYDVFDYAHHCYVRSEQGWTGQMIGDELGMGRVQAAQHLSIKNKLCPDAWGMARGVTTNENLVTSCKDSIVTLDVTKVTPWKETHFRALFKHLAYDGTEIVATEQVKAIQEILEGFANEGIKVTARWIEEIAQKYAKIAEMKKLVRDAELDAGTAMDFCSKIDDGDFEIEQLKNALGAVGKKIPRLYVGRAENMDFLDNESVGLLITSPPYNLKNDEWPMGGQGRTPREDGIGYDQHDDSMAEDEYQSWQLACLREMYRVAKSGASLFYNHKVRIKDGIAIHPMQWIGHPDNPWTLRQEIIWDRRSTHNHSATLFWPHDERIYWMTKGKPALPDRSIGMPTIWSMGAPIPGTWHPAPFPSDLPRMCIKAIATDDTIVLDPFCGSGTTAKVASEEFGLEAITVDISAEYINKVGEENGWTKTS